ncbi:MAG: beta-lactamase family protein [Lentisphaeraceae bacterium]|nr:beta-lactamase family protein [Lentisphaeraceae bacterium]
MKQLGLELFPETQRAIELGIEQQLHTCAQVYISRYQEPIASFSLGNFTEQLPCSNSTLMPWMSCSKMITALAFAILTERTNIGFSTRVKEVIPEFAVNGKENITFAHLLNHTCGIRLLALRTHVQTWDETISAICAMPVEKNWSIGEDAGYHIATSWFILGEAIQRISSLSLTDFIQKEIFNPLEMNNSYLSMSTEMYDSPEIEVAKFYKTDTQPIRPAVDRYAKSINRCWPGASGRGPISELGRFMEMLANGGTYGLKRLLSERTIEQISTASRVGLLDKTFNKVIDWGLGFMLDSKHYQDVYPYSFGPGCSEETFGHNGNQSSAAYVDVENDLVVCFGFNGLPGEAKHQLRLHAINQAIYTDLGIL